jgi:hypothetical protein
VHNLPYLRQLVIALGGLTLLLSLFIAGCGDEGEAVTMDITNPDANNPQPPVTPPVDNPPADNPPDNPPQEPPVNPPDNPPQEPPDNPPDEPPVEPPPEEPPVEPPPPPPPPPPEPKVSFKNDLLPILNANCAFPFCHGPNPPSGLQLVAYATFQKGGNSGPAFIPKNGKGSLIVRRIDGGGMPLGRPPLNKDQIQLFIDWIDEGAENN